MERILSAEEMRCADLYNINNLGINEQNLIERAGKVVAEEIIKKYHGGITLVVIGKGNNGKDGRVIAEVLSKTHGFTVSVLDINNGIFKTLEKNYNIIVDCIFGTGLNREVTGKEKEIINLINKSKAHKVSCDIPSGINGTTGKVMGVAVKAELTVAIQEYKLGHFLGDGIDYSGQVVLRDIGISVWGDNYVKRLTSLDANKILSYQKRNVNKGDFGKCAIVGGSKTYSGGAILSYNALSSLKTGVGYTTLCVPKSLYGNYFGLLKEAILFVFNDNGESMLFDEDFLKGLLKYDCISFGMGLTATKDVYYSLKYLIENYKGTLIIDADGLNSLSYFGVDVLLNKKCNIVLTPHILEFSRLSNIEKNDILSDSISLAKSFAKKYNVTLVLKNAVSVITDGEQVILNTSGCSGMAKAGSGDVLSGVLCGILSRFGFNTDNVALATYLFGKAGEYASKNLTNYCMIASDIIDCLPLVIKDIVQ